MDSFQLLKRRTTDLLHSLPQSLPSMPTMPSLGGGGKGHSSSGLKGTWEKISVPPLPRSSHSVNIVAGTVYIFGGEVEPRKPVDNDMHAVTLPSSGCQADYYAIKARAAAPTTTTTTTTTTATTTTTTSSSEPGEPTTVDVEREEEEGGGGGDDASTTTPAVDKGKGLASSGPVVLDDVPSPRVGHATATIGHRIFLFGGRGGPDMTPLDEGGRVWIFDTRTRLWTFLDPMHPVPDSISVPSPRSYHSAVATEKPNEFAPHNPSPAYHHHHHHPRPQPPPDGSVGSQIRQLTRADSWRDWAAGDSEDVGIPQRPIVGSVAERAVDADADGYGTFLIHGGCLADGSSRAADVWAFDVRSRVWQRLPDAPGAPRGGVALALTRSRLYRFGGFNGTGEEGGQLDYLELVTESFNDAFTAGGEQEVAVSAKGGWQSLIRGKEDVGYKEVDPVVKPLTLAQEVGLEGGVRGREGGEDAWPGPRSVAALEAVTVGGGREYLVLMLGERDPSIEGGHAGAGKFWDDVWAFQVPALHGTAASLADTVLSAVGRKSAEGKWAKVETGPHDDEDDASIPGPGARGWIASGTMGDLEENGIVIWGGLDGQNQRLGDGWIFRLG